MIIRGKEKNEVTFWSFLANATPDIDVVWRARYLHCLRPDSLCRFGQFQMCRLCVLHNRLQQLMVLLSLPTTTMTMMMMLMMLILSIQMLLLCVLNPIPKYRLLIENLIDYCLSYFVWYPLQFGSNFASVLCASVRSFSVEHRRLIPI